MSEKINENDSRYRLSGSLNPKSLPMLAADILKWSLGHSDVRILDGPGDGRRDILSRTPDGELHLTQCKHHVDDSKSVSSRETDEIVIALAKFDLKSATFFTNGRISPQAKREYLDNFPQYTLDYIDGDLLLQFVEESPLLARMWLHGSTLGMTTHRILVPFVIRNAVDDSVVDVKSAYGKNHEVFWGTHDLFTPYRPTRKTENNSSFSVGKIIEDRRLSLTELPIAIDEMKQKILLGLNPDQVVLIVRFGKPALINPRSENDDDLIWIGGIEPESYVVSSNGDICSEKEWLLPVLDSSWQFPENVSVAEVDWSGWFSDTRDSFLMYDIKWPYVVGSQMFTEMIEAAEREAVRQSLFIAVPDSKLLSQFQKLNPHWEVRLGESFVLGWLHPYLRQAKTGRAGGVTTQGEKHIPTHPDEEAFVIEIDNIRDLLKKYSLEEFDAERAIHLAAAAATPLVNKKIYDVAPAIQLREYFEEIPSPIYLLDRTMSYIQMWELEDESLADTEVKLDALESEFTDGFSLRVDVKKGWVTGRLFAMVRVCAKNVGPESATEHASRLIDFVTDMQPTLLELIQSTWKDAVLATKRFWRDEVGMAFKDGRVIGKPWMMFMPSEDAPSQKPKLYIIPPDEIGDNEV